MARLAQKCIYCGNRKATTVDHVPPKAIFSRPLPGDLRTVPCCEPCNKAAGLDDEYFRDALAISAYDVPSAKQLAGSFIRSVTRAGSSRYKRELLESMREEDLTTPAGIHLGRSTVCPVDGRRLTAVVERTVRGLFYWHEKRRLSPSCPVYPYESTAVVLQRPDMISGLQEIGKWVQGSDGIGSVIGDVFAYRYAFREPNSDTTWWMLLFYESVLYFVRTGRYPKTPASADDAASKLIVPEQSE